MLYSLNGQWPAELPQRIRMPDGTTRTDKSTFTESDIAAAGYVPANDPPATTQDQMLSWNGSEWGVVDAPLITTEQKWQQVRQKRDTLINAISWRLERWSSQQRLGMQPVDDIAALDMYVQMLRLVPEQLDPDDIVWPEVPAVAYPDS